LSVEDIELLAAKKLLTVERRYCLAGHRRISVLQNLRAEAPVFFFLVRK